MLPVARLCRAAALAVHRPAAPSTAASVSASISSGFPTSAADFGRRLSTAAAAPEAAETAAAAAAAATAADSDATGEVSQRRRGVVSGFDASGHVVEFHHSEVAAADNWQAKETWSVDWRGVLGEATDHVRAAQQHMEEHGRSAYDVQLEKFAGGAAGSLTVPDALLDMVTTAQDAALTTKDGMTVVDEAVWAADHAAFEEAFRTLDAGLAQLRPTSGPTAADREEYRAALDDGAPDAELQALLHAFETDALTDPHCTYVRPDDPEYAQAVAAAAKQDPFEQPIPEDEEALFFNEYDSYKDIKNDYARHLEHWDDFSSVKLEEPMYKQYKGDVQDVARLLEDNPSYTKDDVASSVALYDALVNKKNAAPEEPKKEFPELDYPPEAPWLFERPVKYPGEELASRIGDSLEYNNTEDVAALEAEALGLTDDATTALGTPKLRLEPQNYDEVGQVDK